MGPVTVGGDVVDIIRGLHNKCNRPGTVPVREVLRRASTSSDPTDGELADIIKRRCEQYGVAPPSSIPQFLDSDVSRNPHLDASHAVVYIDEIDKISSYTPHGQSKGVVGTRDVQQNLLKIIEEVRQSRVSSGIRKGMSQRFGR